MAFLLYFQAFLLPVLVVWAARYGTLGYFVGVFSVLVIHPIGDYVAGSATSSALRQEKGYLWEVAPLLFLVLECFYLSWALCQFTHAGLLDLEKFGLILSTGFITGSFGFTLAHEFIHRRNPILRSLGMAFLLFVSYLHYRIFHIAWHHRYVATPKDPGTALKGETLYQFWFRTIPGNYRVSWEVETRRLLSKKQSVYSLNNKMLQFALGQTLFYLGIYLVYGKAGLSFFLLQSCVAILLLESIHYVEHYGLVRAILPTGNFEAIAEKHTWDAPQRYTNWYLFNVGFHSDHHLEPSHPYQNLRLREGSKKLPYGLSTMLVIAFFPRYWFRLINPRLEISAREML